MKTTNFPRMYCLSRYIIIFAFVFSISPLQSISANAGNFIQPAYLEQSLPDNQLITYDVNKSNKGKPSIEPSSTLNWTLRFDSPSFDIYDLEVYNGSLYAGSSSAQNDGRLYRFNGTQWIDLNFAETIGKTVALVEAFIVYNNQLYIGTRVDDGYTKYVQIYRYDGNEFILDFSGTGSSGFAGISNLTIHNGSLFASNGSPAGVVYKRIGDDNWEVVGSAIEPGSPVRYVTSFQNSLYAGTGGYGDEAKIWRWTGSDWLLVKNLADYFYQDGIAYMVPYNNRLYVSTYSYDENNPGPIFAYDGSEWTLIKTTDGCVAVTLSLTNDQLWSGACDGQVFVLDGLTNFVEMGSAGTQGVIQFEKFGNDIFASTGGGGKIFSAHLTSLSVSHIEITQAIQDELNSVILIANKPTFARVYVDCGEGCSSLQNVTGTLRCERNGEQIGPPIHPVNISITANHKPWTEQRGDLRNSLNFTLPQSWLSAGEITIIADIQDIQLHETISFYNANPLRIAYIKIREVHNPLEIYEPDDADMKSADTLFRKLFPTDIIEYFLLPEILEWKVPLSCQILPPGDKRNVCLGSDLTALLNSKYKNSYGDILFGWLPRAPETYFGRYGWSDPKWHKNGKGQVAFGVSFPNKIENNRTTTHEIGHMLGATHPTGSNTIQQWGLDGYGFGWLGSSNSALHDPSITNDYMSYETWDQSTTWVSPFTWNKTYTFKLKPGVLTPAKNSADVEQPYLDVSALVFTDDTVSVDPIWVITSSSQDTLPVGTNYCLETQDESTNFLSQSCFDLDFIDYETGATTDVDGFRTMLPYSEAVKRIVLKKGTTELFVMTVSPNPPTITLTSPNGGETWAASGTQTITWSASDLDADALTYNVDYSTDGINWLPIGSNLTDPLIEIDAADLPGSVTARVRVTATDGVNTVSDQSDAVFTVAEKGPQAQIYSPEESPITVGSGLVLLQGSGYDLEDGSLSDTSLSWTSSLDGALGTGSFIQPNLTPGSHTITLTVTDSDGNSGSTATVINVATCYMLTVTHSGSGDDPVATPGYSSVCPTGYYLEGESISFSGANSDVGWLISGWTGTNNNSSTETNNTLTMPANHQVAAVIYSPDLVPPTLPTLVSPAANAEVRGTPEYSWNGSADSAAYFFQYDTNSDFSSPEFTSDEISSNTFTPPTQIPGVYYWHVKARDAAGNWSNWSAYRKITIKPVIPAAPSLVSPAQGKMTNDNTPTFTWKSVPDGYKYRIQLSKTNTFTSPVFKNIVLTPGVLTFTAPKLADGKYFWRVMAINLLDEGKNWSVVRNFTVDTVKPAAPLLSSPANNASVTGIPTYKWQAVSGVKYYQFSYATNSTFTTGVYTSAKLTVLSFKPTTQPKGTFYWRVRSQDAAGNWSSWSLVRKVILK